MRVSNVAILWSNVQTDPVGFGFEGCRRGRLLCVRWWLRSVRRNEDIPQNEVKIATYAHKFTFVKQCAYDQDGRVYVYGRCRSSGCNTVTSLIESFVQCVNCFMGHNKFIIIHNFVPDILPTNKSTLYVTPRRV